MKLTYKLVLASVLFLQNLPAFGWSETGHYTTCQIAWNHLTDKARAEIHAILGNESFAEQCTWADIVRPSDQWNYTAPWHYISLEENETYFDSRSINPKGDVFQAIIETNDKIASPAISRTEKKAWLRFIAHFTGDVHQPLHVGHKRDNGGNKVSVSWFGKKKFDAVYMQQVVPTGEPCVGDGAFIHPPTGECVRMKKEESSYNLHKIWDQQLIEYYMDQIHLDPEPGDSDYRHLALAKNLDQNLDRDQIQNWKSVQMFGWVQESLVGRDRAYDIGSGKLGASYYRTNIAFVKTRILQGGYRLAAILNRTFDKQPYGISKSKFVDYLTLEFKERLKKVLLQPVEGQ